MMRVREIRVGTVRELLEIADELARREPGKPRVTSLRRAVSSAYYALFHALCYACADALVGWNKHWDLFSPIYRSPDHRETERRLKAAKHLGPDVQAIAQAFATLQVQRHAADYDPRPPDFANRSDVLAIIDQARDAVDRIESLPGDTYQRLAVELIKRGR